MEVGWLTCWPPSPSLVIELTYHAVKDLYVDDYAVQWIEERWTIVRQTLWLLHVSNSALWDLRGGFPTVNNYAKKRFVNLAVVSLVGARCCCFEPVFLWLGPSDPGVLNSPSRDLLVWTLTTANATCSMLLFRDSFPVACSIGSRWPELSFKGLGRMCSHNCWRFVLGAAVCIRIPVACSIGSRWPELSFEGLVCMCSHNCWRFVLGAVVSYPYSCRLLSRIQVTWTFLRGACSYMLLQLLTIRARCCCLVPVFLSVAAFDPGDLNSQAVDFAAGV